MKTSLGLKPSMPREKYLRSLRPFYDSDLVKVITGIRRCGKSFLLYSVMQELIARGKEDRIIYLPLDRRGFRSVHSPDELDALIQAQMKDSGLYYIFIDEVQNIEGFETVVLAYEEEGHSIFLTGSNSYLLSDEISTKLTGRYLTFEVFPLDFKEYLEMKDFLKLPKSEDLFLEFDLFVRDGGFPKALLFPPNGAKQKYVSEIVSEIFTKDVMKRKHLKRPELFRRVRSYIINNFGATFSLSSLQEAFASVGIPVKTNTLHNYLDYMKKAKLVYECLRFDLRTKKSLAREQKFYLADMSLYYAENVDARVNYGSTLENLVYLYLKSQGYQVSIGLIGKFECDFIIRKPSGDYAYIQVTYSLSTGDKEEVEARKEREFRPFRFVRDGYPRYLISLDRFRDTQEGVHHINAIDLFMGKETI